MKKLFARREEPERAPVAVQLPDHGFEHPFQHSVNHRIQPRGMEHPRTIAELLMCAVLHVIRERPNWWEEMKDRAVTEKWKKEILQQQKASGAYPSRRVTTAMINYVFKELHGYASLRDPVTGIEVGPAERIWKSDEFIPISQREKSLAAVVPLETVPDSEWDWNPGSDDLVRNLIDPSLYPIVYGRTIGKALGSDTITILEPPELDDADPSDGKVTLTSPYINNTHPTRHKELYSVIPEILERALPMFERVLSDLVRPLLPMRIARPDGGLGGSCIWEDEPSNEDEYHEGKATYEKYSRTPDALRKYFGDLQVMNDRISLKGRTLQVIVKVENIVLTPERPEYPGGRWCVEGLRSLATRGRVGTDFVKHQGMRNEMIVSTFIYYYDSENITKSRLFFGRATSEPETHGRDDAMCMKTFYNMDRDTPCVQGIGNVVIYAHKCVAFPNLYQHRVQPFRLEDPTKPGHRKILVFFLVDPTQEVLSATDVAPQQREWVTEAMYHAGQNSEFSKLPFELLTKISSENEVAVTRSEAEKYRKEMASERAIAVDENNMTYFGRVRPRRWLRVD